MDFPRLPYSFNKISINSYSPNQPCKAKRKPFFFLSSSYLPLTSKTTKEDETHRIDDEEAKALGLAKRQPVPGADGGAHFSHSRLSGNGAVGQEVLRADVQSVLRCGGQAPPRAAAASGGAPSGTRCPLPERNGPGSLSLPARRRRGARARSWRVRGDAAAVGPVAIAVVHGERAVERGRAVWEFGGAGPVERDGVEGCWGRGGGACKELAEVVAGKMQAGDRYGDWVYCGGV
ncbi:hypothetical protein LR48_Vigan11g097600 [Vigna angularis]|uniref:Uncharacterized protein n=1 Tax=Phaseolus angularis TaxID=3914 RepID=A0A0L9VSP2_PHAAN|nr:hypothetical protein LR48_Vigan11g097600 [Vigna angularis]